MPGQNSTYTRVRKTGATSSYRHFRHQNQGNPYGCATRTGGANRPDAHRGHQFARRVYLPDRAVQGSTATVTSGSKITRLCRLNDPRKRPIILPVHANRTPFLSSRLRVHSSNSPRISRAKYRHFWHGNQGNPYIEGVTGSDARSIGSSMPTGSAAHRCRGDPRSPILRVL